MQFEKREMKMRLAGKAGRAAVFCLCAGLVLAIGLAEQCRAVACDQPGQGGARLGA